MVFGIGFSVAPIGEQPDNLEPLRRAAADQNCHRHFVTTLLDRLADDTRRAAKQPTTWQAIPPAAVMAITKW